VARKDEGSIPTGRIRRTAKVAGLAGGQTARNYATKAANLTRGEQKRREAAARRQAEAAEQILDVLGNMKGAAMKVGQVASYIDTGAFPEEFQARIQEKLAELRDSAPRVAFEEMRAVIEDGLDARIGDVFAEFDEAAVAAASIGQVYRARLRDDEGGRLAGREVAVKVQYPGVAEAVRADLQNLGLLLRVLKRIAPGIDVKGTSAEIRERLTDELDYEQEAQAQRAMARAWRDHPFVVIPEVATALSSERVLVTEWIAGRPFEAVSELPEAERDRFGEIVYRFFAGGLYRNGHFSGDPHPGNYRLLDDGRVMFLDFGMTKHVDGDHLERERAAMRAGMAGDAEALHQALIAAGYYAPDFEIDSRLVLDHFRDVTAWYVDDGVLTVDRALVTRVLIDSGDPRSPHWEVMRRATLPPDAMFARRMEGLVLGVLGHLGATANWHRIARELMFGDPASTPLGELEAEHFGERRAAA
jgi:predicted unusual protein kinase regulating ubiquinone biosynthesis (AarF/ABC1/UbiB family)